MFQIRKCIELIIRIDANLIYLSSIVLPDLVQDKIRRTGFLKSSLFSARIEGNDLTYEQIDMGDGVTKEEQQVQNIYKAAQFIESSQDSLKITLETILNLHFQVLAGFSNEAGFFRIEPSGIFNQAGEAVYIHPAPDSIPELLKRMLVFSNGARQEFPIVNAFVSHLIFEKIHPFIDGNGRVARILVFAVLKSKQKDNFFFIPFEEYLDGHKEEYCYHLEKGLENTDAYLKFMLRAFYEQTEKTKQAAAEEIAKEQFLLTPRQEGILNIIKDQRIVSFDEIRRGFLEVPPRTLSYDLKKLINKKLVFKIGETKGVYYKIC